jgi:O-antigen ligase
MYLNILNRKISILDAVSAFALAGILVTLVLSTLNANSIFIMLLFVSVLLRKDLAGGIRNAWKEPFFRACTFFFLLFVAGIFYSPSLRDGLKSAEMRTALVAIPFIFCSKKLSAILRWETIMLFFCFTVLLISIGCLGTALFYVLKTGETHYLFYHELVKPVGYHAIYYSVFVFICIIFLLEHSKSKGLFSNRYLYYFLMLFFTSFMILLSSKLLLSVLFLFLLRKVLKVTSAKTKLVSLIIVCLPVIILFAVDNPVKRRFQDMVHFDAAKFSSKDLRAEYFNGLEFRLVQWKLVAEILNERKCWIYGVSPADAQNVLDSKYREYHFYEGDPKVGDHGFLGYDTHSQFLQCVLQSGIIGLVAFLYVCFALVKLAIKAKLPELWMTVILLLAFCFTEVILQSQRGLITFMLFPLLNYYCNRLKPV